MRIKKSIGTTRTETLLSELCEQTFLKLWSYPNPYKEDGKELCDLLVVFDDYVFIFFDRESERLRNGKGDLAIQWQRWKKEVIDKQLNTARGAAKYVNSGRPIFLDSKRKQAFPVSIPTNPKVFQFVVAHGAMEACRARSEDNITGSLAIGYVPSIGPELDEPFFVSLPRDEITHVLDSENLGIILHELDTIFDFSRYFDEKERAIARYQMLTYCGEEDLLAHYMLNGSDNAGGHRIGSDELFEFVHIGEGEWRDFALSHAYEAKKKADSISYIWDALIQKTSENALNGTGSGNANPFVGRSAINYMAREPRFVRRAFAEQINKAIEAFPEDSGPIARHVSLMPSFYQNQSYVFLQLWVQDKGDYDTEYRPKRTEILQIACVAAKQKFPDLERVIGIAIDAPKFADGVNSEDLVLIEFADIETSTLKHFEELNEHFRFFCNPTMTKKKVCEFPVPFRAESPREVRKVGRNQQCSCGSGLKYKRCCLR